MDEAEVVTDGTKTWTKNKCKQTRGTGIGETAFDSIQASQGRGQCSGISKAE